MKYLLSIIILLSPLLIQAEGFARDSLGQISEEVISIPLTHEQKEILKMGRYIILNPEQQIAIKNITTDTILQVLTENYNDCTCQQRFGIWFHPDSIGIPYYIDYNDKFDREVLANLKKNGQTEELIKYKKRQLQFKQQRYYYAKNRFKPPLNKHEIFYVSPIGNIFYNEREISSSEAIRLINDIIDKYDKERKDDDEEIYPTITINWPPVYQNPNREQVLFFKYILERTTFNDYLHYN